MKCKHDLPSGLQSRSHYWFTGDQTQIYQETNKKSLRVLNEAFIKVQNVHPFFISRYLKILFIQQSKIFALEELKFQIPVWTLLQNLCEESTAHYPTSRVRNVSARKGGPAVGWQRHRPRRFHGISGSYPSPAFSSGPSFLKGGYFCSSTDQPGPGVYHRLCLGKHYFSSYQSLKFPLTSGKLVEVARVNESRKFPKTLGLLNCPDS